MPRYEDTFDVERVGVYNQAMQGTNSKRYEMAGETVKCSVCGDAGIYLSKTSGGPPRGKELARVIERTRYGSKGQVLGTEGMLQDYERRYMVACLCSWDAEKGKVGMQNARGITEARREAGG